VDPADIVRGYLAAATVRQLEFAGAGAWADAIERETDRDVSGIVLEEVAVTREVAKLSAELVAQAIVATPMASLENHALGEIQNWRDRDEAIVDELGESLTTATPIPSELAGGVYAAHLVAAATTGAVRRGASLPLLSDGWSIS
jgi:hypothetical protein